MSKQISPAREQQFKILLNLVKFKGSVTSRDLAPLAYPEEWLRAEQVTLENVGVMLDEMTELGMVTRQIKGNGLVGDLVYRVAGSSEKSTPESMEDNQVGKRKVEKKKSAGPPREKKKPKSKGSRQAKKTANNAIKKASEKKRQKDLKGIDRSPHADLNKAIKVYVKFRDARQAVLLDEVEAQKELLALMKEHEETEYSFEGFIASIVHEDEKVKVKRQKVNIPDDD